MIRNGPDIIMPLDIRQKSYTEFDIRLGIEFDSLLDAELDILPDIRYLAKYPPLEMRSAKLFLWITLSACKYLSK